jgi:ribosomal protein L35
MPKLKSKKACTKRFRINKNGVMKHGIAFKRHGMFNRSKRRTSQHGTHIASENMMHVLKKTFPYSAIRKSKKTKLIKKQIEQRKLIKNQIVLNT